MPGGGSVESWESSLVMRFFAGGARVPEFIAGAGVVLAMYLLEWNGTERAVTSFCVVLI